MLRGDHHVGGMPSFPLTEGDGIMLRCQEGWAFDRTGLNFKTVRWFLIMISCLRVFTLLIMLAVAERVFIDNI